MDLRGFFGRHRIASAAAAPAVLGVAAIVGASFIIPSASESVETELTSSVTDCHDMVTISIAGRGDVPGEGVAMLEDVNGKALPAAMSGDYKSDWLDPIINAPGAAGGDYAAMYIDYPADMATYEDAVAAGVENSQRVMQEIQVACPDTQFSIVGYSEGADVARRVAMNIGNQEAGADGKYGIIDPARVLGVVILADAGREVGEGPFPGAKDPFGRPDGFDQQYQTGKNTAGGKGAIPDIAGSFGALDGKVASFCSDGDLTCAAPENISLLQLAVNVGRQINVDALEREGLTPATGQDLAMAFGRIAFAAFADIQSQKDWMQSDETFLDVLLKVSTPGYEVETAEAGDDDATGDEGTPGDKVGTEVSATEDDPKDAIETEKLSPLAYLPQKFFREIVGLIMTNQNTIPVIQSDPYNLTLGPNASGHHFDYWDDAGEGKPLTSAQYAAAWLTHLSKQAQAGLPVDTKAKPKAADVTEAIELAAETKAADKGVAVEAEATEAPAAGNADTSTEDKQAAPTSEAPAASPAVPAETPKAEASPEVATPPASKVAAPETETPEANTEKATTTVATTAPTTTTPVPVG